MTEVFPSLLTYSDWGLLVLRIGVGAIFLIHGLQKFKMWKMKPSEQMSAGMIATMRLLSIAEPLGALAIMSGFLIQLAAIGLGIIMLGAIYTKITKWGKKFTGDGGWELDFMIFTACVAIVFLGAGSFAF